MQEVDFLQPSINAIRKSIQGIDDSYSNYWDILAELVQNSVDAIRISGRKDGKINIEINQNKRSIRIIDNGCGIKASDVPVLLSPFSTNKTDVYETVGEKGVGLKFVIFQSDFFELVTKHMDEDVSTRVHIKGARTWLASNDDYLPKLQCEHLEPASNDGTDIIVECSKYDDDEEEDSYLALFKMNLTQLKFVLRTKTAIGDLNSITGDGQLNIDVSLSLVDRRNETFMEKIPFSYWLPTESLKSKDKCDLDEFKEWSKEKDRSDADKKRYFKNKAIIKCGRKDVSGHDISYWTCFLPNRNLWDDLSKGDNLETEDHYRDVNPIGDFQGMVFPSHQPGISISVKGMPTGIQIEPPKTGVSGYWSNMLFIFNDNDAKFDIGRKSITGANKKRYQGLAKEIFKEYTSYISKYVSSGDIEIRNINWSRDDTVKEVEQLPKLDLPHDSAIKFLKMPTEQEASVAAIFYELIGLGELEFTPIISGYRNRYDLYAYIKGHFVTVEFKSHLRNLIKDFDDEIKMFNEIDFVVCWDVNDDDKTALDKSGIQLEKMDGGSSWLNGHDTNSLIEQASKATHRMSYGAMAKPIYVIDLKKLLDAS